jgi:putative oxidoreductase
MLRAVVAIVLLTHPLYMFTHADAMRDLASRLAEWGVPWALGFAWIAAACVMVSAALLLAARFVFPAALMAASFVAAAALLFHAPYWYVVGGGADVDHPGVELHVLLLVGLGATAWMAWRDGAGQGDRSAEEALSVARVGPAAMILAHALYPFVLWDLAGMRDFGQEMEHIGFPFGGVLVWCIVTTQALSSFALLAKRFVVPACLGHLVVLGNGLWIAHAGRWFVVGPGRDGMEYSVLYIACFTGVLVTYWPRRAAGAAAGRLATASREVAAVI